MVIVIGLLLSMFMWFEVLLDQYQSKHKLNLNNCQCLAEENAFIIYLIIISNHYGNAYCISNYF